MACRSLAVLAILTPLTAHAAFDDRPEPPTARDQHPAEAVSFPGRVVDLASGKPVRDAVVLVQRMLPGIAPARWPRWAVDSTHTSDADGRFQLTFPAEQVAEDRLAVRLRISHPDYVGRKNINTVPLAELLLARRSGNPTFCAEIKLEKGVEYTGQVVTPAGQPVALAAFELTRVGTWSNPSDTFIDETKGTTESDGRFRLRLARSQQLIIYVTPPDHATFQRFWGPDRPSPNPAAFNSPDLGRLVVGRGVRLTGRLVDVQGRPIAGQRLAASAIFSQFERTTTTNSDGRFAFAPLRQGNYVVYAEGQKVSGGVNAAEPSLSVMGTVFPPTNVYLRDGIVPGPLNLRELATVTVQARFVDSRGRPHRGHVVGLWGQLPIALNLQQQQQLEQIFDGNFLSATINGPERELKTPQTNWSAQLLPDPEGRVVLRAPKGLQNVAVHTYPPDETLAIRGQFGEGKPLTYWFGGRLDDLTSNVAGITFVVYQSPRILVTIKTEDGDPHPAQAGVNGSFTHEGGDFGANFVEQADHRYRSQNLMPDEEYELVASAPGFVSNRVQRVRLREGTVAELTLVVRHQPHPPAAGDHAPPFFVRANNGEVISLDDLRGNFVLLHFWHPAWVNCVQELPRLKKLHDRFGKGQRLALLGFCLVKDKAEAVKVIKDKELTWPQITLWDRWNDSIVVEYQAAQLPNAILIGPGGQLIARDLQGDKIDEAVLKALGQK
jgi:peroxiredoxin